jgi:glutamine amidotransferase
MVTIIDYGIGNLRSIEKAFEHEGIDVLRTDDPTAVAEADYLVLPGVGAFGACMQEVIDRGLVDPIKETVANGVPFLGVCVGMQMLFDIGEERGTYEGLGLLPGRVKKFDFPNRADTTKERLKIPHMGWNTVSPNRRHPLLADIDREAFFYFVHSFHVVCENPSDILATTEYGYTFPAMVHRNNVMGVQFHPEKSQTNGLTLLRNFAHLAVATT